MDSKYNRFLLLAALAALPFASQARNDTPAARPAATHSSDAARSNDADATAARDVDNTGMNKRDRNDATTTAEDQPNNKSDLAVEASVRRAIVDDSSLSTMAHNIKIVTEGGVVTLRGPVQNADEKKRIAALVAKTSGVARVDNQLDVKR